MENKEIKLNNFIGNEKESCYEFLGIRYAQIKRFEYCNIINDYPQKYLANKKAPSSMQKRAYERFEHLEIPERAFYHKEFRDGIKFEYSEDYLHLNIYTPKNEGIYPVIVFFHGGGFDSGSINESPFDGEELAKRGNVVVFAQYRVGVFGYLCHEDIYKTYSRDGNFGLDDMISSLKWVRKNINLFNGDNNNITLMGQSAGAMSIQYLLCSDLANALFDKAIMMSGAGLFPKFSLPRKCEETREYWKEVIEISNCKSFDEFKNLSSEKILEAVEIQKSKRKDNTYNTMPVVDGYILKDSIDKLIKNPRNVPLIIGITNNDMFTFLLAHISKKYAKKHHAYLYYFDIDAKGDNNQAFHSSDLRYVFGTLNTSWRPYDDYDYKISNMMMDYISNFTKSGNPNGNVLPKWEVFTNKALCITPDSVSMGKTNTIKLIKNTFLGDPK